MIRTSQNPRNKVPIRVLVISNFRLLLQSLTELVKSLPRRFTLVGSASSLDDAAALINKTGADLVLLDFDSGTEATLDLIQALHGVSQVKILLLTRLENHKHEDQAIVFGARGVLQQDTSPELLLNALQKVHEGQIWLNHEATGRVFGVLSNIGNKKSADDADADVKNSQLTTREQAIVECVMNCNGEPGRVIAEKLHISESTLRNHLTAIYGKLGVANRHGLVAYAFQNGLARHLDSSH